MLPHPTLLSFYHQLLLCRIFVYHITPLLFGDKINSQQQFRNKLMYNSNWDFDGVTNLKLKLFLQNCRKMFFFPFLRQLGRSYGTDRSRLTRIIRLQSHTREDCRKLRSCEEVSNMNIVSCSPGTGTGCWWRPQR